MKNHLLALFLFLGSFGFFLHFAAPSVTTGDSGEFMAAAATLSLPHAPSFPTYTLMAKSFITLVPLGSVPYRCNVFSAVLSAGTLVLLFYIGMTLHGGGLQSFLTAVLVGLTGSYFENSLVTEVFALNSFFVALLSLCLVRKSFALFAFVLGLGLGNHQILLFMVPAAVLAILSSSPRKGGGEEGGNPTPGPSPYWEGKLIFWFCLFVLGLSVYLTLPIRSAKEPPLNWGQPTTVEKFKRTITRADYGSLKLAIGETPERNLVNAVKHIKNFFVHLAHEVPLPALLLGLYVFFTEAFRRNQWVWMLVAFFLVSGPFFFWLGNLPFTAQSDGIIGRFLIMPVMALLIGLPLALQRRKWIGTALLTVCVMLAFQKNIAMAQEMRTTRLVLDYGRAMLRSLPLNAAFYMDGGDDAFYSLAMLQFVEGKRRDVELHDRGGLVFKNPYGPDFRSIPKDEKQKRRLEVERAVLAQRPLYYGTMDLKVHPDIPVTQAGFIMRAGKKGAPVMDWQVMIIRSLYPLKPNNYRMRALGAFFPYMRGRQLLRSGYWEAALVYFHKARQIGPDIEWLGTNLGVEYANAAYERLVQNKFSESELIYRDWIRMDPASAQAQSNLGVVLERSGRIEEAKAQYEKTKDLFPTSADPVYNLAVLAWKEGKWPMVVEYLEEVLRRKPDHLQAQGYLKVARERLKK